MNKLILLLFAVCLWTACNNPSKDAPATNPGNTTDNTPPDIAFSVVKAYPHDTSAYTEGFLFHDGKLYESTGTEPDMPADRRSLFGTVDMATGKITPKAEIPRDKYFGEGIAFLDGKVYQLTYTTKVGFIYDAKTFKKLGEFTYPSKEGWGMTTDGSSLIMSDGTSNITYLDPNTFRVVKILGVTDNNGPVSNINELELIKGYLYANQWQTNYILKIDTASGKVVGKINLDSLVGQAKNQYPGAEVLNGIAYDSTSGKVYVTGKLWPSIYEIKFPF
ncbi:glutaminyl-peptide cyclotransferase [Puia dinghuensis]|uniref:Glutaminyl-peptide cyclotransferase n=1 Tax=Puia dinghuensis TaxID=1792502 RepID=A0A8J2XS41_9BACT|nr:glutaminyl-peptide cyclotransferase [Puia dinghuensis]GGA91928.1 glutaminyl-peptide cyclotransferase [Puia dinghuensis]